MGVGLLRRINCVSQVLQAQEPRQTLLACGTAAYHQVMVQVALHYTLSTFGRRVRAITRVLWKRRELRFCPGCSSVSETEWDAGGQHFCYVCGAPDTLHLGTPEAIWFLQAYQGERRVSHRRGTFQYRIRS